jgi:hypothetical protein
MSEQPVRYFHIWRLAIAIALAVLTGVALVWAFAEEPLGFRDPATGQVYQLEDGYPEISTIHDDLTYALALAAGFSITDSQILQIWNQLVDSEALPGAVVSYTNGGGAFYPAPNPATVCTAPPYLPIAWPRWEDMIVSTSVTSRFGPYSPFFHFPHKSGPYADQDIGALRNWGWGLTSTLVAYEAYAWGGATVMQATCRYTRTAVITTSIEAGSLQAFATYLHSLADAYSHQDCIAAMDNLGMPWATHTTVGIPECLYHPQSMQSDDVHGREFFTYTESYSHTDPAILAVYSELVTRSLQREGQYWPISLDTRITGTLTLGQALYNFVHTWDYDHAAERRDYADMIAKAVNPQLVQRLPIRRVYLPITLR